MTVPAQVSSPYYKTYGGHPAQSELLTDRAIVTEAYTEIPKGVLRDIVTSQFPDFTKTRAWVLNRPVAGGPTTFSQVIVEIEPGGGATKPEPQADISSFLFVVGGQLTLTLEGEEHVLTEGGFAYIPPNANWSLDNNGETITTFHWFRKRYEALDYVPLPKAKIGNEQDIVPGSMPGTDNKWRTTRMLDPEDMSYDFGVNIVTFEPGASIPFMETHIMEHGLYVLEGKGVYRLNGDWVEVEAGDYMALRAFCPQACYAGGPSNFRYLLYKDQNRQITL